MPARDSQLTVTKLKPAVRLANAIRRPRLLSLIDDTALPKVVLVTAGAGFGKTTLLAQWHEALSNRAGWLSLDRNDQDPICFLRHFIAAVNHAGPVISAATESFIEGRATTELVGVAGRVCNDLAKLKKDRIIFLDDYYLAETPILNELLMTLIERSPAYIHLVIASRTFPPLPVASLKARNALLEISAQELKFNQPEADTFMHEARKLDLGPSEMRVLNERTEGWAAGLQLASLYLKDSKDQKRSIENLSGGIRDITDYLATDVVSRLAPDLKEFLLRTSVLERMNAAICNALLDRTDGQSALEQIEALGLFLFPLDATREWYRYHHLFRDFLLIQLKRKDPGLAHELCRKASSWFAAEGFAEEAVDMALGADDFDQAAMLVESSAMKMIKNGHMPQVNRWILRLPEQVINQRLRFPAFHGWALIHMGKCHQAESLLGRAEIAIDQLRKGSNPISENEQDLLRAELRTLRAVGAAMADDMERAYELSRDPFPDRPEFAFFSGGRSNVLGMCAISRGEFELAKISGDAAKRFHGIAESPYGVVYGHCVCALAYRARGRISAAMAEVEAGEAIARRAVGPKTFCAAMPRVLRGVLLYELNILDEAYSILEDNLPLVEECAYTEIRTAGFLAMAGILGARRQIGPALLRLDQAISVSSECIIDRTQALVDHETVRLRFMAGDVVGARRFASHIDIEDVIEPPTEWEKTRVFRSLLRCRLLIAEGNAQRAVPHLEALAELAAGARRAARHVQILTLLSLAYAKAGRREKMLATISDVLRIGAGEGYVRSVIDQGYEVGQLFLEFGKDKSKCSALSPDLAHYLNDLCSVFVKEEAALKRPQSQKVSMQTHASNPVDGRAESFTDKEMQILRLLAGGASNSQIGEAQNVSVNTVRWHVGNILSKLGVDNRTQAASAAHSLGLIA